MTHRPAEHHKTLLHYTAISLLPTSTSLSFPSSHIGTEVRALSVAQGRQYLEPGHVLHLWTCEESTHVVVPAICSACVYYKNISRFRCSDHWPSEKGARSWSCVSTGTHDQVAATPSQDVHRCVNSKTLGYFWYRCTTKNKTSCLDSRGKTIIHRTPWRQNMHVSKRQDMPWIIAHNTKQDGPHGTPTDFGRLIVWLRYEWGDCFAWAPLSDRDCYRRPE
jgi:hypothetical protein